MNATRTKVWVDPGFGYWPDGWDPVPGFRTTGPGFVALGDQGHQVTGAHTWNTTLDHLQSAVSYVKALYNEESDVYDLYNHNCVQEATYIGDSYFFLSIPSSIYTPWDFSNYLNGL